MIPSRSRVGLHPAWLLACVIHRLVLVLAASMMMMTTVPARAQQASGTLVMIVQPEPVNLAPYLVAANPTSVVGTKIYEGLLEYDFSLNPKPSLAKSWKVSGDGKTMTFQLQEGIRFSDGKPFTSADVQFSVMDVLKKYHQRGRVTFKDVEAVDTPDPLTAVFRLKQPAPYILAALSSYESPMVPKHLLQGADVLTAPLNNKPMGTGPFMLVEWKKGQYIRLDRNPNYWKKGLPRLERIVMRFIGDAATRVAAIENGEAQYGSLSAVPNIDIARVAKLPHIAVTTKGNEVINPIVEIQINTKHKPLNDPKVRQALSYAIDRKFVVENIWYGFGRPARGPIHSNVKHLATTEGLPDWSRPDRLAIANKLLDEAGLKPDNSGTRFTITLDILPFGQEWRRLGEYLQQAFGQVGVKLNLRYEDLPTFIRRVFTNYDFDMMTTVNFNQSDPVIGTHRLYHSQWIQKGVAWVNGTQWSSKKADTLMDQAAIENDPQKRRALYHELQRELSEQLPNIWINELDWVTVHNKKLLNVDNSPLGVFSSFAEATLTK